MKYIIWNKREGVIRVLHGRLNLDYAIELASLGHELTEHEYGMPCEYKVIDGQLFCYPFPFQISD